jgi:hypothetical protein
MLEYNTRNVGVIEIGQHEEKVWTSISAAAKYHKVCRHRLSKSIDSGKTLRDSLFVTLPDPDLPGEMWLPISDLARISSEGRFHSKRGRKHYGTLKSSYKSVFSNKHHHYVHRLVAEFFLPPAEKNQTQVDHIDGDSVNNHVNNLEWVTPSENMRRVHVMKRK